MKSRDLDLQSSEVPCAWPTNTHTHTRTGTKLIFQPGMCPGSPKLPKTAGIFFPSAGCLKYLLLSPGGVRVSGWPECAFQMDVCHRTIDMLPAVASTNHTPPIVVQQPSDKQHDKQSHLWGHPSPDRIYQVFSFTEAVTARTMSELTRWVQGEHWCCGSTVPASDVDEWFSPVISHLGYLCALHLKRGTWVEGGHCLEQLAGEGEGIFFYSSYTGEHGSLTYQPLNKSLRNPTIHIHTFNSHLYGQLQLHL